MEKMIAKIGKKRTLIIAGVLIVVIILLWLGIYFAGNGIRFEDGKESETISQVAENEKKELSTEIERESENMTAEETSMEETTEVTTEEAVEETTEEPTTEPVEIEDCDDVVWALTDVNIRASWNAGSDRIGALLYGQSIRRTGICSNGWIRVSYRDGEGYMNGRYLTEEEIVIEPETEAPTETRVPTEKVTDFHVDIFADVYQANKLKINHPTFTISQDLSSRFAAVLDAPSTDVKFYAMAIDESFSFGYNPDKTYFAASTVKAGLALVVYREIELGNINPNDIIVYQKGMYYDGSGIIQFEPYGTEYTIQQLIDYSLIYSDNIAYNTLRDMNNRRNATLYDEMIRNLGCTSSRLGSRNWVNTNARDMVKVLREIYQYGQVSPYGQALLNTMQNTQWNILQEEIPDKICQSKIGWTEDVYTMIGIIYGEKPYLFCISSPEEDTLRKTIVLCDDIVDEYIQYEK